MKKAFIIIGFFLSTLAFSQEKPKLIIGIVVDQMRYDYLDRFQHSFSDDGFKRILREGFYCRNVNYNYKPTYTGPGHASIFTGTTPSVHGIVGNNWYSREEGLSVYCVKDQNKKGEVWNSPNRMLVESFADGMKHYFNHRSKSYGVSLKDRGAILPAGHLADGAYWFSSENGIWESSTYYEQQNPRWLSDFNKQGFKEKYLSEDWTLSQKASFYESSKPDETNSEQQFNEDIPSVFPYDLEKIYEKVGWGVLKQIPMGNQMTMDLAKVIIKEEKLGADEFTDFLSISFSATDYVGHQFGTQSMEVQDIYIKLDQTIADLLQLIDKRFTKNEVLLFITSDHGAAMPRNYLKEQGIPTGKLNTRGMKEKLEKQLDEQIADALWINKIQNLNVYFNQKTKATYQKQWDQIAAITMNVLEADSGIYKVLEANDIQGKDRRIKKTALGVMPNRSGEFVMIEYPNWTSYPDQGSTHGSPYAYDTHVPLLFYGFGIKHGESKQPHPITAIIPTISFISGIPFDSANQEEIIQEIVR